jgi:hypothetical protein
VKFDADLIVNMSLPVKIALNTDHTLRSFAFDSNRFKTRSGTYNFISGKDNLGLGLDDGATYELTDRLIVSASVTDLGFINWKKNITNLIVKSNFEFGGLDVSDVINGTETFDRLGTDLADSLKKAFHFTKSNNYYKEHLQYNVNLGASYNLNKRISLGLLAYRKIQNNQVNKSLTFSANMNLGNVFSSSLSYNFANYEQNGLGVGMAVRAGMIQLYFLSDRIPLTWNRIKTDKSRSILLPANWNIVDMRLGLNLVFGDQKKKADKPMITYD